MRQVNLSRGKAVLIIGALITALGIPSALSQGGPLSDFLIFDLSFLDLVDTITDSYFLPIGGLIVVLFVGWGWKTKEALEYDDFIIPSISKFCLFLIRFFDSFMLLLFLFTTIYFF